MAIDFDRLAKKLVEQHAGPFTAAEVASFFAFLDAADHVDPIGEDALLALRAEFGMGDLAARRVRGKWLLTLTPKGQAHLEHLLSRVEA
jgi:hypothetical protein